MQPGMMNAGMMQPGMMQPGMMNAGMMQPGMMQPGMMQPGMMQPGMMNTGMMQPGMMNTGMTMSQGSIQPGQMTGMMNGQMGMQPGQMTISHGPMQYGQMMGMNNNQMGMQNNQQSQGGNAPKSEPSKNMNIEFHVKGVVIGVQGNSSMTITKLIQNFKTKLCDNSVIVDKYIMHPSNAELDPNSTETLSDKGINEKVKIDVRIK